MSEEFIYWINLERELPNLSLNTANRLFIILSENVILVNPSTALNIGPQLYDSESS